MLHTLDVATRVQVMVPLMAVAHWWISMRALVVMCIVERYMQVDDQQGLM